MTPLNSLICFVAAFLAAWFVRQTVDKNERLSLAIRIPLVLLSGTMFLRGIFLMEGGAVAVIDVLRDLGFAGFLICLIANNWRDLGRL